MSLGWWIAGAVGLVWIASLVRRRSADLPPGDDDGTLVRLVGMGFKVEAIRRFRARHGGGLKDAKEAVERLAQGGRAHLPDRPIPPEASEDIEALVREGRHLEAIKAYREAHPEVDLVTAKQAVDRLREHPKT